LARRQWGQTISMGSARRRCGVLESGPAVDDRLAGRRAFRCRWREQAVCLSGAAVDVGNALRRICHGLRFTSRALRCRCGKIDGL
jgi:hypothetical protein